jgi:hypothetical protein
VRTVEEEYLDVLQNIEFAIVQSARAEATLIDVDVLDALEALVRHYGAEENGRRTPDHRLAEKPARVFAAVKDMCEWRLGRQKLGDPNDEPGVPIAVSALVACLRRIQKSIRLWNKEGGRKGYLDFVSRYIR